MNRTCLARIPAWRLISQGLITPGSKGMGLMVMGLMAMGLATSCAPDAPAANANDGSALPFPPTPTASIAKPRLQVCTMKRRVQPQRLPKDAPNILIVMLDDIGFGVTETFGGDVHTPTLTKLAAEGIRYNSFHTTSICSPTRAALLTGRNHTRVGRGQSPSERSTGTATRA